MSSRTAGSVAAGAAAVVGSGLYLSRRYRRELAAAWTRLDTFDRDTVATPFGTVEYAVRGRGDPVLVSHGIFHGCDGALLSVRDLLDGRRIIAPSRFGYLGSSLPAGATPADQADAFAALLDHLRVERTDVIGISAGATAALQLALRHPNRVEHLILLAGNLPGGTTAVRQPDWAGLLYNDAAMWTLKTLLSPVMARLSGVPPGFVCSADDQRFVAELVDSLFPVAPRADGIGFDAFVSNPDVNACPLERITVPTLLIHARDDPLASYAAAEQAVRRIAGSELVSLERGGHLMLGQADRVAARVASFITATPAVTRVDREPVRRR